MSDIGETLFETFLLGGLFWLGHQSGKQSAVKQMTEDLQSLELQRLRKELDDLKRKQQLDALEA